MYGGINTQDVVSDGKLLDEKLSKRGEIDEQRGCLSTPISLWSEEVNDIDHYVKRT